MTQLLAVLAFLTGFFPPLSIAGAYVALGLFVVAAAGALGIRPRRTEFDLPAVAFVAVWLVSSLLGRAPLHSLGSAASQLRFFVFYLLVWTAGGRYADNAFRGYLWGAGAAVVYGLAQFGITRLASPETVAQLSERLGPTGFRYLTLANGRVHGAVHPLTYAELLLPAFFFSATRYLDSADGASRLRRLLAFMAMGVTLLLTQSRGPWLGALAGLAAIGALHRKRLWLLLPAALLAGTLVLNRGLTDRAATLSSKHRDPSTNIRLTLWRDGLYIFRRNPVAGVGPRELKPATEYYRGMPDFPPNPFGFESDMHNVYLQHLAERGLLGLAALLFLLIAPLRAAWKAFQRDGGAASLAAVAFYAGFFVLNLTERAFDDAEVALVFWILAALIVARSQPLAEKTS